MKFDLNQYKGTIVKLINIFNNSEIYGYLEDQDETSGLIVINKPIVSINRMVADSAGTMNSIIKYSYKERDGNTVTVPLATVFSNDGIDKHLVYLNLSNFIFIPLYDKSYDEEILLDKNSNVVQIRKTFMDYIEFIYSTYTDVLHNIHQAAVSIVDEDNSTI